MGPHTVELDDVFDCRFLGRVVQFKEGGPWRLASMIHASSHNQDLERAFAESCGVFTAIALTDNEFTACGEEAIVKIWCQHHPQSVAQCEADLENTNQPSQSDAMTEHYELTRLIQRGVECVPGFAECLWARQDDDMPFPGGQINYVLQEKVPGENLMNFFEKYTYVEREKVRAAFVKAVA